MTRQVGAPARILIVDDHELLRRGVRSLLSGDSRFEVCGEAENGQEGIEKVRELNPELVTLDVSMPVLNGLEAARQIRRLFPSIKILILSMHDSPQMAEELRQAGADAVMVKIAPAGELVATVERLLQLTPRKPA